MFWAAHVAQFITFICIYVSVPSSVYFSIYQLSRPVPEKMFYNCKSEIFFSSKVRSYILKSDRIHIPKFTRQDKDSVLNTF